MLALPLAPRLLAARALALLVTVGCAGAPSPATTTAPVDTRPPAAAAPDAAAAPLSAVELRLRAAVAARYDAHVTLLQRAVDIPSGSLNVAGVRKVGELLAEELRAMGFEVRLAELPESMGRGPHLVAVHRGTRGPRFLLIGHLDTVFEGAGQGWVQQDTVARGAGTSDMKGGDVAMLLALRALHDAGVLKEMTVRVVMTGDEEFTGTPVAVTRAPLLDAARESDIALGFEGGSPRRIALGRRGSSSWSLSVSARQAHSSGIFRAGVGYGAIYEGARILDEFRREMAGERGLTFNVGLVGGGATLQSDTTAYALEAAGKGNIVPPAFVARGDLRFLTEAQKDSARARMRAIVARPLEGAQSSISFSDGYPAMPVTPAGERLLALFSETSRSLGYPAVTATAPEDRGAADISFVAPFVVGLDGLGVDGAGSHSPRELVYLPSLRMSAERAAVFMHRLYEAHEGSRP